MPKTHGQPQEGDHPFGLCATCLRQPRGPGSFRCTDRWMRLAIINAIRLIARLPSAARRVRFFQLEVIEQPRW